MAKLLCRILTFALVCAPAASFAHSPLPTKPNIPGIRNVFWYTLRDLDKSLNSWLSKENKEQAAYRKTPEAGIDLEAERQSAETIYELIRADYLKLLESGEIDQIDMKYSEYGIRQSIGDAIYGHSLSVHYHFGEALEIIKRQLNDRRYRTTIFFTTYVHPDHKPLESLSSLSQSSARANALVERVLESVRSKMTLAQSQMKELVESAQNPDADQNLLKLKLAQFKHDSRQLDYRINWFSRKLLSASQFANDTLRKTSNANTVFQLEGRMATLGQALNKTLKSYQDDHDSRYSNQTRSLVTFSQNGFLSNPDEDLNDIFGRRGHVGGVTLFENERGYQGQNAYSILSDSATLQYLIAAGAAMAKVSDLPEVRGTIGERAKQELNYRKAQISSMLKSEQASQSTALTVGSNNSSVADKPVRRNFLSEDQKIRRSEIEDRLWRVFFEHAGLIEFAEPESESCAKMVTKMSGLIDKL